VDVFALTLVIPLLAIYAERLGATPFQATLLVSVFSACQLVAGPVLGRLSDQFGRKPLLLISQAGTLLGFLLMARADSLALLYVARALDGATAGNLSLAQAWISDNTPPEKRTRAFGLIGIAFGLGFFIGPWVTGVLSHRHGLTAPIYLAAALSGVSILCTALLLRERSAAAPAAPAEGMPVYRRPGVLELDTYLRYFRHPTLGPRFLQFFLFSFAFATFTSGFALFAERTFRWQGQAFTPREIGFVFAYSGFLGIVLQGGIIGRLAKRFGDRWLVLTGFFAAGLAYLLLGAIDTIPLLALTATISAYGNGVLRPALTSLISQAVGPGEQGVALGLGQSLGSLASVVAPALGGILIEHQWLSAWAWSSAAAAALGLLAARRSREPAPA
jgi:DHA1 family tetracycline resistance protein-like MFS transporter